MNMGGKIRIPQSATDEAIRILCDWNLHRHLWLPATDKHGRLRVTFSTTSNIEDASLPVMLFPGPMSAPRYAILQVAQLAKEHGVRVVFTDRPGMGGSTPADVSQRISVWLETVPILLQTLKIKHVCLVTHSAGTLYTLNTMYHYREILDPKAPYVALMAPWVHNEHSNATLMNVASKLPKSAVGSLSGLQRFVLTNVNPAIGWSGGVISSVSDMFATSSENGEDDQADAEKYGVSVETAKELVRLMLKFQLAEDSSAVSEEALLCLKKSGPGSWGHCEDYERFVEDFCAKEAQMRSSGDCSAKLVMKAFFAESDIIIGEGGYKYYEKCWSQPCVPDVVDFSSKQLPGTNHETIIVDMKKGALKQIFEDVKATATVS